MPSRKHFEWSAKYIARVLVGEQAIGAEVFALALFQTFNPRFDVGRFLARLHDLQKEAQSERTEYRKALAVEAQS
jgi:hypothetical protein